MENQGMVQEAKIVVGLDFGTTFSGFAYALRSDPDKVYTFYGWPMQAEGGGLPYCKTQTSLLYSDATDGSMDLFELREWGWPAFAKHKSMSSSVADPVHKASGSDSSVIHHLDELSLSGSNKKQPPASTRSSSGIGHFLTLFKLHLAPEDTSTASHTPSVPALPPGMTAKRAITDYLREMSKFILQEVRNKFGSHITLDDVQWCVTVPAIWDEHAKREMRDCCERAGLVQGPKSQDGGSPHPLKLLIEPEAASAYCQLKLRDHTWNNGDEFLVVDCGGGTVDLVLHEKLGSAPAVSVREVQESSGALCGGYCIDALFFCFLKRKISCFERFEKGYPAIALAFRQDWERVKNCYGAENGLDVHIVELPPKLAEMWEQEQATSMVSQSPTSSGCFDELQLSEDDMKSFFDPVVDRILRLIEERMVSGLKAIMVVGGFSASPYLMARISETFGGRVAAIVSPAAPGSAVCCGAVTMGIRSDAVVSRISKKTYGMNVSLPFVSGVHPPSSKVIDELGQIYCSSGFYTYVRKGDEVRFDDCVKTYSYPVRQDQSSVFVELYSSDCKDVTYVTDPGIRKEGQFIISCPTYYSLGFEPLVEVSMYFGRAEIQVTAIGLNFDSLKKEMLPVKFERHSIF